MITEVDQLTVLAPVVSNMFDKLNSFFDQLEVPLESPEIPELPPMRQMALLAFLQTQRSRTEIDAGLDQLQILRSLLLECQIALVSQLNPFRR